MCCVDYIVFNLYVVYILHIDLFVVFCTSSLDEFCCRDMYIIVYMYEKEHLYETYMVFSIEITIYDIILLWRARQYLRFEDQTRCN